MSKPIASWSLDLDNKWAYLRTHGIEGWEKYPSYLELVVPRILRCAAERGLKMTCFVVGRDAELEKNHEALQALAAAGHEMGNHTFSHEPWLERFTRTELEAEIARAEEQIEQVTGQRPIGFRGPGYSLTDATLEILVERGYQYDASTLPTYIGPLARWYFRKTATLEAGERAERRELFGSLCEGLRSVKPYLWDTPGGPLVEIPVTTVPVVKLPIHMTYLVYLAQFSQRLATTYLRSALAICRLTGARPSMLLHPLDFLGKEDDAELRFFPGMSLSFEEKQRLLDNVLDQLTSHYDLVPLRTLAEQIWQKHGLQPPQHPAILPQEPLAVAMMEE